MVLSTNKVLHIIGTVSVINKLENARPLTTNMVPLYYAIPEDGHALHTLFTLFLLSTGSASLHASWKHHTKIQNAPSISEQYEAKMHLAIFIL